MDDKNPVTSLTTITLCIIKEIRLEKRIHQARMADFCGKSTSAWTKIESGQTSLSMEVFFKACYELKEDPSDILRIVDIYANYLFDNKWVICENSVESDDLLKQMSEFYSSEAFNKYIEPRDFSVMHSSRRRHSRNMKIIDVINFVTDSKFKEKVLNNPTSFSRDPRYSY